MDRVIAALLLLSATHGAAAVTEAATAAETVEISVTHLPNHAGWSILYRLEKPAERLRFFDDFGDRRSHWHVDTAGLRLTRRDGEDQIESIQGRHFSEVKLRFASDSTKLERHYLLNQRFTDGSEWIYTTYLYATPIRGALRERTIAFQIRLKPHANESVILKGQRRAGSVAWNDTYQQDVENGTFVYFGRVTPVETPDVVAVVDPGLPTPLRKTFEEQLPAVLRYYGEQTGYRPAQRPEILIAYEPTSSDRGFVGDTLPGMVDFNFLGPEWMTVDADHKRQAFRLIAHESAHIWNGELFSSAENATEPWMHEGGADAFALLAAHHLDIADDNALRAEIEKQLNWCLTGLTEEHEPLQRASQKRLDLVYPCGSAMNLFIDAELRDRGGLFAFWRALFARAEAAGRRYDVRQFFDTIAQLAGNDFLAARLHRIWAGPLPDAEVAFAELLQRIGVEARTAARSPELALTWAKEAMSRLMAADCGGALDFATQPDRFEIAGLPQCAVLNRRVTIVALAGEKIADNGEAVYAAVAERCADGRDVEAKLADTGAMLALRCAKPFPPLRPYLTIDRWPLSPK